MGPRGLGRGATATVTALLVLGVGGAKAATLTVTTTTDELNSDGQCSLREAIAAVDAPNTPTDCGTADNAGNTIVLGPTEFALSIQPSGADTNSTGDLNVQGTAGLTIAGAGMGATVISGAGLKDPHKDRLLRVASGSVTLENLTLRDGRAPDGAAGIGSATSGLAPTAGQPGSDGGAISNGGTVNLDHVALINDSAGNGGMGGSTNTLAGSSNGARGGDGGRGGGIYNAPAAVLNLTDVTLSANRSGNGGQGGDADGTNNAGGDGGCCGDGGGLFNDGGSVHVDASTFSQNIAGDGGPGGIGGSPQSGGPGMGGTGQGGSSGGAIATAGGSLTITNSTIDGNLGGSGGNGGFGGIVSATNVGGGGNAGNGSAGGGIFARAGSAVTLTNVTIAQNASGGPGTPGPGTPNGSAGSAPQAAGVFVNTASVTAKDTLLASNAVGNCGGPTAPSDGGHNLSFSGGGCPSTFATGDPKLGPLQDNGGPTQTMALGAGSAAIDKGAGCRLTDQRGAVRPSGPACDIGAYEVTPPASTTGPATSVTSAGATLNGSVTPNQASATTHFEYGTTTAYGTTSASQPVSGFSPTQASIPIAGLSPSTTYHYRVIATSADGSTAGSDQTFTTAAAPPGTSAPKLTGLSLHPSAFRTAKRKHHRHDQTGTTLSYTDSQAATTTFTVSRCTKIKKHRCTHFSRVGSFSHQDSPGPSSFRWNGGIGRTRLKPGRYQLVVSARSGRLVGRPLSASFKVVG